MITFVLAVGAILAVYLVISSWFIGGKGEYAAAALRAFLGAMLAVAVVVAVFYLKAEGMIE